MRVVIPGFNREPAQYGRDAKEAELVIDVDVDDEDQMITLMINAEIISVPRSSLAAFLKLL